MISRKQQFYLLTSALEGVSNYWYYLPNLSMLPSKDYTPTAPEIDYPECLVSRIWEAIQNGEEIPVCDCERTSDKLGIISKKAIREANELMLKNAPEHFANILNENDDAETADVWLQFVVMKKIVFG